MGRVPGPDRAQATAAPQPRHGRRAVRHRRTPAPSWFVLALAVLMFGCLLVVNGVATSQIAPDAEAPPPGATTRVPAALADGGAVVSGTGASARGLELPPRTLALTFDDGPDPTWTPRILEVLRRHDARATFFVVGTAAARHPDLLREIDAAGSEVGVHTYTHTDLGTASTPRLDWELAQTQLVLDGALGKGSFLLRPPYSSSPDAVDDAGLDAVDRAHEAGYVTVLSDLDSRDWQRPGADAIVRNATPADGRGAVVLMHDAGGDRAQTVAALDRLLPALTAQGYRFTTVSEAIGLPNEQRPTSTEDHWLGLATIATVAIATGIVSVLGWALIAVGVLTLLRLLLMLVIARRHHRTRRAPGFSWGRAVTEPVAVVVPAYNERANIAATVRSLVASDHPVEVVVVDDGSTDGTADIVEALRLPGVRVVRQANAGKPAALNTGIAHTRRGIVVMIDGDTVFERDTVRRLVQPFGDGSVGAVAGNARVVRQGGRRARLLAAWQHIEYVVGFNVDRRVYDVLRCMPTIPGAVGAFRRSVLVEVGGVSSDTLAEDTDLTMAVVRRGHRVVYEETARAWTEAPATLGQLWRQRYRWSYGTMQSMWKHRSAVLERGASGRLGRVGLAHLALFQVVLPLFSPLIDVFLVYGLLFLDPWTTLALWGGMLAVQMLSAAVAFRMEREPLRVLLLLPLQQLVYRQLMYAVVIRAVLSALGGVRLGWQKLKRVGGLDALVGPPPPAPAERPVPAGRGERR